MNKKVEALRCVVSWVYENRKPIGILLTSLVTLIGAEIATEEPIVSTVASVITDKTGVNS